MLEGHVSSAVSTRFPPLNKLHQHLPRTAPSKARGPRQRCTESSKSHGSWSQGTCVPRPAPHVPDVSFSVIELIKHCILHPIRAWVNSTVDKENERFIFRFNCMRTCGSWRRLVVRQEDYRSRGRGAGGHPTPAARTCPSPTPVHYGLLHSLGSSIPVLFIQIINIKVSMEWGL